MDGDRITFQSAGGDIILRGHSGRNDANGSSGIQTQRQLVIDSGSGTILIDGKKTADKIGAGLRFGGQNKFPDVAITSSSSSVPAIQIKGTSNKGHGILLGLGSSASAPSGTVLIQSSSATGGGIQIHGSTGAASGDSTIEAIKLDGGDQQTYQFLSNNGNIDIASITDEPRAYIDVNADTYLGQRKDSTAIQDVDPISGLTNAVTSFRADKYVGFRRTDAVFGEGYVDIYPFTSGKSISINTSGGDLRVNNLANIRNTFQGITVGDSTNTNGISSSYEVDFKSPTTFNSGTSDISFTYRVKSQGVNAVSYTHLTLPTIYSV